MSDTMLPRCAYQIAAELVVISMCGDGFFANLEDPTDVLPTYLPRTLDDDGCGRSASK